MKHDFPIGSKHIIDGKEVVVTEIHDPMTANCMASYPMVFFEEVASTQNYETSHTCNCQHNSNSRDNESCCRCDSRQTNADRIRNMSDEELAEFLATVTSDVICGSSWDYDEWIKELQSETE